MPEDKCFVVLEKPDYVQAKQESLQSCHFFSPLSTIFLKFLHVLNRDFSKPSCERKMCQAGLSNTDLSNSNQILYLFFSFF